MHNIKVCVCPKKCIDIFICIENLLLQTEILTEIIALSANTTLTGSTLNPLTHEMLFALQVDKLSQKRLVKERKRGPTQQNNFTVQMFSEFLLELMTLWLQNKKLHYCPKAVNNLSGCCHPTKSFSSLLYQLVSSLNKADCDSNKKRNRSTSCIHRILSCLHDLIID